MLLPAGAQAREKCVGARPSGASCEMSKGPKKQGGEAAKPASLSDPTDPEVALMRQQAYEDHRGAFQITRGRHEPLHHKGPSNVYTVYLWRYITLYDPRGDTHVRRAAELRDLIAKVEQEKGELYVIVGHRAMSRSINAGIIAMVEDTSLFEHLTTFWAPEELHCLHCYHYRPTPVANSKNSL